MWMAFGVQSSLYSHFMPCVPGIHSGSTTTLVRKQLLKMSECTFWVSLSPDRSTFKLYFFPRLSRNQWKINWWGFYLRFVFVVLKCKWVILNTKRTWYVQKASARWLISRTVSGRNPTKTMALYCSEGASSVRTMSSFPDRAEEQAGQMAGVRLNSPEPCRSQKIWEQAVTQAKPLNLPRHLGKLQTRL